MEQTMANTRRAHLVGPANDLSLAMLLGPLEYLGAQSVLEVGAGGGRCMKYLKAKRPGMKVVGLEPEAEFREVARANGIPGGELVDGVADSLPFDAQSFDVVYAIGVLHHVPRPTEAVLEMLRVARQAVFISDGNNFGQGGLLARSAKQMLNAARLWSLANWVKTRGRGYLVTEGDGVSYSYSVFNDYQLLRSRCRSVHLMNMAPAGVNPYRSASDVIVLAIK